LRSSILIILKIFYVNGFSLKKVKSISWLKLLISVIYIDHSVILETLEGERFILGNTLDELVNQLDPLKFFRCNRQVIVNVDAITIVIPYFKNSLLLRLDTK